MIVFFVSFVALCSLTILLPDNYDFENYQKVVLVSGEMLGDDYVECGNDYFCTFMNDDWKNFQDKSRAMIFYFEKFDFSSFSQECDEIYSCGKIEDKKVYEGVYKNSQKSVIVNNKKVNFQLALTDDGAILGFPMIVVGF